MLVLDKQKYKLLAQRILEHKPNIVGFSTWCINYPFSLLIAAEIKKENPEITILFGGPQASILPKLTLQKFQFVDFVLAGEAELTLPIFLTELNKITSDWTTIPGLSYRARNGIILSNKYDKTVDDLDALPIPAYDLIPNARWLKIDVGRGCPFRCVFCSTSDFFSRKYRVKTTDRIVSEMLHAYSQRKIRSFSFAHDMFTFSKVFVFELCEKLIRIQQQQGIEFKWTCSARVDCVSKEMLIAMQKAGCTDIFFGIETGSKRMQKIIQKNLNLLEIYKVTEICKQIKINVHASYIIGFPEESKSDLNDTLKSILILSSNAVLTQASELTILPGTPLYASQLDNLKFDGRFSNFSRNDCGPKEMELIKNHREIFSSFYFLPVDTITRFEMLFLRSLINKSKNFRNTLFLLAKFILKRIEKVDLVNILKKECGKIDRSNLNLESITLYSINYIEKLIIREKAIESLPYIMDVFSYESYCAMLKTMYFQLNMHSSMSTNREIDQKTIIYATPIWKVLTTKHQLEKVTPEDNSWTMNSDGTSIGNYYYLLVAVSNTSCNRIEIKEKEKYLLDHLSKLYFSDYVNKVNSVASEEEVLIWINKMRKLGVVEIL